MKKYIVIALLLGSCVFLNAQTKKKNTYVGVEFGTQMPKMNKSIKVSKLGIPSFSYAASIEKRFTINNHLNFSLEYSMNYLRYAKNYQFNTTSQNLSSSIAIKTYQPVVNHAQFIGGVGVNAPFITNNAKTTSFGCFPSNEVESDISKRYSSKLNPYMLIGIENRTKLFNRNLIYSLQYNFGFMPLFRTQGFETATIENAVNNGFRIGLKYKY